MAVGWFDDLDDANDYYDEERFITDLWDELSDDKKKNSLIINAYNRLYYHPDYDFPTYADATAQEKIELRKVNGEMAYYLLMHLEAEDRRQGLQAQAVIEAGIVKEKYKDIKIPIPPVIEGMIDKWKKVKATAGLIDLARDEEERANTDVYID